jgi:DNA-binding CsgD family transcriptional regulator
MLASRPGLSPVMVGRAAELDELRRLLDRVDDQPLVALVTGEAGVGKSRLVRELVTGLSRSTPVITGQASEDAGQPFDAVRDALDGHVRAWAELPPALGAWAHPLRHLLGHPIDAGEHRDDHVHAPDELLRAGIELVRIIAGGGPAVFVIEDLHWADADSIALFGRLAATQALPLLVIGTFRTEDLDRHHPLAGLLPTLERQRSVTHVALRRLSADELGVLLEAVYGRPVAAAVVEALHRRTLGNPFFAEELIAAASGRSPEDLVSAPLPWNAAEAVLRRLDVLSSEERRVLDAAAVLGHRVPFDLLAQVCRIDEDDLIEVLSRLVDVGLLIEHETDLFAFRHALTREAVGGELLGRQRRRLHERALEVLRELGSEDDAVLAHHAACAGRAEEAARHLRAAAVRALREGAPPQALRLAEQGLAGAEDDIVLAAVAARAAWATGALAAAERYGEQWRDLAVEAGNAAEESAALRNLAGCRWAAGDLDGYWAHIHQALEVAERLGPTEELAWALAYRAQAHLLSRDAVEALVWADRALELVERIGADGVRPHVLVTRGTALTDDPERVDEGVRLLQRGREEATAIGDLVTLGRALNNAVLPMISAAATADAGKLIEEGMAIADRYGLDMFAASFSVIAVQLAQIEGDAAQAERQLEIAHRFEGGGLRQVELASMEAYQRMEEGDLDAAEVVLQAAEAVAAGLGPSMELDDRNAMIVDLAARRGDAARLRAAVDRFVDQREQPGRTFGGVAVGLALLEAGTPPADVRSLIGDAPPPTSFGKYEAWSDQLEGALLEAEGDLEGAVAALRNALDAPSGWRPASLIADGRLRLARILDRLGRRTEAREQAALAADLLERWPGRRRDAARGLLRRLGGGDADGLLTARELEVLGLISEGLTNRQIAERLFIARKTAAVHVSNILAKTGLSTRTEAATWALREGLVEGGRSRSAP